jgi:hypothetical protein
VEQLLIWQVLSITAPPPPPSLASMHISPHASVVPPSFFTHAVVHLRAARQEGLSTHAVNGAQHIDPRHESQVAFPVEYCPAPVPTAGHAPPSLGVLVSLPPEPVSVGGAASLLATVGEDDELHAPMPTAPAKQTKRAMHTDFMKPPWKDPRS